MHIPDGYLSPSTCAALYLSSGPFWYTSLRRLKSELHTRFVPLISLFAAFSFVIMMFNIPLPGGTTGHAVGVGIASIVLGPWGSIVAISIALIIQAIFFADGGITAIGANCFNIAIAGSLVAYFAYRLLAGRAPLDSSRRAVAAGLAGYAAINVAALLTAIEFGIQPLLFRDSSGAPLYAPYPLGIAVPAMMIGHLTIAGVAELVISAGVVAWLQRTDLRLLRRTGGTAVTHGDAESSSAALRKLWAALAVLMILTPLGLVAAGSAWGEWSPEELRGLMKVPAGLQSLSGIWNAPVPAYAPALLQSRAFGYVLSAMMGAGLIILCCIIIAWLVDRGRSRTPTTAGFGE